MLPPVWSATHGSLIVAWRHSSTMCFIGWMCQRGLLTRWVTWCTAVFMVRHGGTLVPRRPFHHVLRRLFSASSAFCKPTPAHCTSLSSQHNMAVGRFRSPARRSGTRCLTSSETRRVILTVLDSFLRQSSLVFTIMWPAHWRFLNVMRYINPRFTYLLYNLISVQSTCRTRSSSVVTLARIDHLYLPHYKSPIGLSHMHHLTRGISSLLHSVNLILSLSSWFTSTCTRHLFAVTTFTLTVYLSLGLSLQSRVLLT